MSNNLIFKQIMHAYELDQLYAKDLYNKRKAELYKTLPRVQEIDSLLARTSLKIAKDLLVTEKMDEIEKEIKELKKNAERLGFERRQLVSESGFSEDYLTNIYKCSECMDTGFALGKKCRCLKQKLINNYYELSNLSRVLENENFVNFSFDFYSKEVDPRFGVSPLANATAIYKACMDFVLNFNKNFSNLLFYGETGLGKTFLCNCIAKDLLDIGASVVYLTAPRFFKKIEDLRFNRDEMESPGEQLDMIFTCDLLIIDDLGSEFSTLITTSELFNIINTRLLDKRQTIISTNLSFSDLQRTYTDRIASRILGNYTMFELIGDDIRLKKKLNSIH